jgi:hypothetical protein
MKLLNLYYQVKPFIPWSLRVLMKRFHADRLTRQPHFYKRWPVSLSAAAKPDCWSGWPQGKRFAVVLTHDVEGQKGLERCVDLMELEARLGFKASFNFIPEGDYQTPPSLRHALEANMFEVGVHDLRHDGKLYLSREEFRKNAVRINEYLKEWGVVGFRSGFMHHRLDWIHDLNIAYDLSTFDTDPLEPQPDPVDTIFPFWVPRPGGGYAEIPYTLTQDSNLFLSLHAKTTEIWERKVDWIAQHGGMVLLNTHPDYIGFDGVERFGEFPAQLYAGFLEKISERYAGEYWQPLPREMAEFVRQHKERMLLQATPLNPVCYEQVTKVAGEPLVGSFSPSFDDPRIRMEQ